MRGFRYDYPVDPDCPEVRNYVDALCEDPMSRGAPIDEIVESFKKRHVAKCDRCQKHGAENVEVVGP